MCAFKAPKSFAANDEIYIKIIEIYEYCKILINK